MRLDNSMKEDSLELIAYVNYQLSTSNIISKFDPMRYEKDFENGRSVETGL